MDVQFYLIKKFTPTINNTMTTSSNIVEKINNNEL